MDFEPPHDDEGDPKKMFWKMLTYQLNARDSRSGQYGPSPLESLLLSSSCSLSPSWYSWCSSGGTIQKFSVVVAEVCG